MRGEDFPPVPIEQARPVLIQGTRRRAGPERGSGLERRAAAGLKTDGSVEFADFPGGQRPGGAGPEAAERDRADPGADQAADRMAGLRQQSPDDVLAPLVQGDLDQRPRSRLLDNPELVRA